MRVLLLGATGLIGRAILPELLRCGHSILALARSDTAQHLLMSKGVDVVEGDLRDPEKWAEAIHQVDAVIHVAATFTDDMGDVDRGLIKSLIARGNENQRSIRFIYTGGVWLYGETGSIVATEQTAFNPISSFAWMIENSALLLRADCFKVNVIHPAMVYDNEGGEFSRFTPRDGRIEIWGASTTRWPLVHAEDLAVAYRLVLESDGWGEAYNVCAEQGVRQQAIANVSAKRHRRPITFEVRSAQSLITEHGEWAQGPTLDQCMSSEKIIQMLGWKPIHSSALRALEDYSPIA